MKLIKIGRENIIVNLEHVATAYYSSPNKIIFRLAGVPEYYCTVTATFNSASEAKEELKKIIG